ncbi:hypothetical protein C8F04DRAFT_1261319 [Mycena alexandri]|uniref:Uncharacterized protein n=1 Tax=Mycena alexandri TaxID=1745969 RepID=A0AAD6SUN7_9AGAR|nr:hypothetical protein C8F04DRAFT_1261319 [Mycena alexandri]
MVCEHLLRNGYRLDDSFDPWAFFTQAGRAVAGLPLSTTFVFLLIYLPFCSISHYNPLAL